MMLFAALLCAQATAAEAPARPRSAVAAASAFVEVLRAERIGDRESPDRLQRQVRRDPRGLLVEFD